MMGGKSGPAVQFDKVMIVVGGRGIGVLDRDIRAAEYKTRHEVHCPFDQFDIGGVHGICGVDDVSSLVHVRRAGEKDQFSSLGDVTRFTSAQFKKRPLSLAQL